MRTTGWLSYPQLLRIEYTEARVDADIAGTGTGPTTSESTPPAHATRSTRPATYLSTRWGLTVTGAPTRIAKPLPALDHRISSTARRIMVICEQVTT